MVVSDAKTALQKIQALAFINRIAYTSHARQRMSERRIRERDVWYAIKNATDCSASSDGLDRWRVKGSDANDIELIVVVVIENKVVVLTIF